VIEKRRIRDVVFGPPRDPMAPETRKHIALAAFLAIATAFTVFLISLAYNQLVELFPNSVFFSSRVVLESDHWWNRWLHSQTPFAMQRLLNDRGIELVILPVMLRETPA